MPLLLYLVHGWLPKAGIRAARGDSRWLLDQRHPKKSIFEFSILWLGGAKARETRVGQGNEEPWWGSGKGTYTAAKRGRAWVSSCRGPQPDTVNKYVVMMIEAAQRASNHIGE